MCCNFTDKELYAWIKCVKGQPHDHKHLMPTQIIPSSGEYKYTLFTECDGTQLVQVIWAYAGV